MQPWNKMEGSILEKQWLREMLKGKCLSCLKGRHSQADCPFPTSVEEELRIHIIKTSGEEALLLMERGRPQEMKVACVCVCVCVCVCYTRL